MVRILSFGILAIFALGAQSVQLPIQETQDVAVPAEIPAEVIAVENIADFLSENPGLEVVELKAEQRAQIRRYTLGQRVSGDRLQAVSRGSFTWPTLHNAAATVRFSGAIVSHVRVTVQQTSNLGRVYTISGGIGQRAIAFVIEARSTKQFIFTAEIFGR
ncbi:hypothetical protein DMENIID0001_118410 [Sergentomyia squamirostris]